jgi:ATP-binding cassette, subfamily C, bacterial CydCD
VKPVDPRLLRHARATRWFLVGTVLLGLAGALLTVGQAVLVADLVVGAFQRQHGLRQLLPQLGLLALVAAGRALVAWLTELAAHRAAAAVKSQLRAALLERATGLGPGWLSEQRRGELATLATRGVDALDDYFARYLPQLALAVVVPAVLLAVILHADWLSALIIAATLPLVPLFMVLIGLATQKRMDRQWRSLARLSHHFLDVVEGLPTLKVFGRAKAQARTIRQVTDDYRAATMRTLRIAFVSSYTLELLSTLSVALVAVSIGLRLVDGGLSLYLGLLVLVLAPEVYTPLRQVGTHYHASVEGLSAAAEIFEVLETPLPAAGTRPVPDDAAITVSGLTITHPGRDTPALRDLSLTLRPGRVTALTGPSGAGKSTLLTALLGFTRPDSGPGGGCVSVGGVPLEQLDPAAWHRRIAWLPQQPALFAGTVADNVRLARPDADDRAVHDALRDAEALDFVRALPDGIRTRLGEGGRGLSGGQRQRLALARVFLADRPLVLLDEPTANLDGESEAAIVRAVGRLAAAPGRTVVLTAHRPALLALADEIHRIPLPTAPSTALPTVPPTVPPTALPLPLSLSQGEQPDPPTTALALSPRAPAAPTEPLLVPVAETRPRLGAATLLGALALGCSIALMALSGWLIARASQQPPVLYLMMAVTGVRTFGLGRSAFRYAERLVAHNAVLRALGALRTTVYLRLEQLAPAALGFRSGDLLSRLVADVDAMQDHYLRYRLPLRSGIAVGALTALAVGWALPSAGLLLALGLLLAGVAVPALAVAVSRGAERRQAPTRGRLATEVVDVLSGTAELTVAGALPARLAGIRATDAELRRLAARSAATAGLGSGLVTLLTGLTVTACAAVGIVATHDHAVHGVMLAVLVLTPLAAFEAVAGLPMAAQVRERSLRAAQRVAEVTEVTEAPERTPPAPPVPLPADPFPVRVRDLAATWPGRPDAALSGLELELTRGRRTAVLGASGSGKTTLAMLLLRFLEPDAGRITLGGVDAAALDADSVRQVIGLCAQDAHVFDSSLRENLRLARPDCAEADLWAALAAARLADWARALPDGLDTMVGEHGARISGGQRQRLALARALLADFPLLILDEPAEHLDLATADALTADLLAATRGRSTLLITHRLAGLEAVDEIVVLDAGRVVQRGSWSDLLLVDGPLRRMWQRERAADALMV